VLNKAQDAIVDLAGVVSARVAKLTAEGVETSDAVQQALKEIMPEVKQVLDAGEKIGPVCDSLKFTSDALGKTATELTGAIADVRGFLDDLRGGRVKFVTQTKVEKA